MTRLLVFPGGVLMYRDEQAWFFNCFLDGRPHLCVHGDALAFETGIRAYRS